MVTHGLVLMAPVALDSALEVIVLALATDPATVREIKVLLVLGWSSSAVCRSYTVHIAVVAEVEGTTACG